MTLPDTQLAEESWRVLMENKEKRPFSKLELKRESNGTFALVLDDVVVESGITREDLLRVIAHAEKGGYK